MRDQHQHPIDSVRWIDPALIDPNPWNPNRVHKPELALLERSILLTGWVQPVLVCPHPDDPERYMIVDGFHRWRLALDSQAVRERSDNRVPVAVLDLDRPSAMLLTVRINRAKGSHAATLMSVLVRSLLDLGVTRERIAGEMGATLAEVDLLATEDVFKARGTKDWAYSPSWYPIEDGRTAAQSRGLEPDLPTAVGDDSL